MGLFSKNPNEVAYTGGKKHWADVIKNSGPGQLLLWRQPEEDFNTNSTLIVMPGEQAIFIKGGNIEQVFDSGTYKLSTNNYPFISRLRNAFTGGISTFNCVVYFVRKADSQELRWGTDTPIQLRDKVWGVRTDIFARAVYKVRIENPAKFLEKLVGNNVPVQFQQDIYKYFDGEFSGKIKTTVAKSISDYDEELIGLDVHMDEISEKIEPEIDKIFQEYGLRCAKFALAGLDVDKTKYDGIDTDIVNAQGKKAAMNILGDDWARQQSATILGDLANNPGAGGAASMGAGMGMGMAAGGVFGNMANEMFKPMHNNYQQPMQQAPADQYGVQQNRFAPAQPAPAAPAEDPMVALGKLKQYLDAGLITQSDYDAKKAEILSRL